MNEKIEKRRDFIINTVYIAILLVLVYLCFKYLLSWLMPFVLGFVIAAAAIPVASALQRLTHINRKVCAVAVVILEYAVVILCIWGLGSKIFGSLMDIFTNLPQYYDSSILPFLNSVGQMIESFAERFSPDTMSQVYSLLESAADNIRGFVIELSSGALGSLAGFTKKIPFFFISLVFTILASLAISTDYSGIKEFIRKQLPQRTVVLIRDAKEQIGITIVKYLRAYFIIFLMTFAELSVGLSVLRIENSIGIAAIIATADILPVIGAGLALVPWAIWSLITQNYFLALGLIILYVVMLVVRNLAEPRIVGSQLGLNPLVTLIAIYIGYRLMGVTGMVCLPILTTISVGLHKAGKLKLWKE